MNTQTLLLSVIRLDGGTQCRASLDAEYIATLAEAWADGAKMPAIVVFNDGSNHWLADGFHRYHAAQKNDFRDILAEVRSGTRLDAVKFALGANAAHGLRRSNADKRRAVEVALKEFPKLSSAEIARICAVSHGTVDNMRNQQPAKLAGSPERIGADGKTRKLPVREVVISTVPTPAPAPVRKEVAEPAAQEAMIEKGVSILADMVRKPNEPKVNAPEWLDVAKRAGEEAESESENLWRLKCLWNKTAKKDRVAFIEWAQRGL